MAMIEWPESICGFIERTPFLSGTSVASGGGMDGIEQIVGGENRVWRVRVTVGKIWREKIVTWRRFIHSLNGRSGVFRLPVANPNALPLGGLAAPDDGVATVDGDTPAGAYAITLGGYCGEHIQAGAFFSINDFLYEVQANTAGAVTFLPALRQDVTDGDDALVVRPYIAVRLDGDEGGRIFPVGTKSTDPVTFSVVEAFDR